MSLTRLGGLDLSAKAILLIFEANLRLDGGNRSLAIVMPGGNSVQIARPVSGVLAHRGLFAGQRRRAHLLDVAGQRTEGKEIEMRHAPGSKPARSANGASRPCPWPRKRKPSPTLSASPRVGPVFSISPWSKAAIRQLHNRRSPRRVDFRSGVLAHSCAARPATTPSGPSMRAT